jgi:hypothetical protein
LQLLKSLVISACHRLGLFTYLRDAWRRDLTHEQDRLNALQRSVHALVAAGNDEASKAAGAAARLETLFQRLRASEHEMRALRTAIAVDQRQRDAWDRLDATLATGTIARHIARAVDAAALDLVPMPHFVLRDLWPADTYAALLDAIPPDDFFPDKDPIKQNLKIRQIHTAPAWTRRALEYVEDTMIPTILTPALVARMQPHLETAYLNEYGPSLGPLVAALPHQATAGRLMLRRPGYTLEPHLDPQRVALTCLLYFARPGDNAKYGTQLFSIDRPVTWTRTNTLYPAREGCECRLAKVVPFEPNTALVFLNRGGAHAAEIPVNAPPDTRRFSYQFYVSPEPGALEALMVESLQA